MPGAFVLYVSDAPCSRKARQIVMRVAARLGNVSVRVRDIHREPPRPEERVGIVPMLERADSHERIVVHVDDEDETARFMRG